jgi:hypothetical protein
MEIKNEIGNVYDRLKVVAFSHIDERRAACWIAECSCGKTVEVKGYRLRQGVTRSCGCLRIESTTETGKNNRQGANYDPRAGIETRAAQ